MGPFPGGGTDGLHDSNLEEAGFELFVPLGISASPSWCSRARKPPWRARGEFLRRGTNSSNPSPSSGESANFWFLSADSGGSRSRIRDDLAQQSDLISLGVPG